MSTDQKLKYTKIKKNIIKKTQDFIMGGDWNSLNIILKSSPKQLIQFCNFSEFEKKIMLKDGSLIESYFIEKNNNQYLSAPIILILSILAEDKQIFSKKFKEFIINKILPDSEKLSGNAQEYINNALGKFLIKVKDEKLTDYPRLFDNLISKYPTEITHSLPKIVKLEWWGAVYRLLMLEPNLITQFPKEIKGLIKNYNFNRYEFNKLRDFLKEHNNSLHDLLLEEQKLRAEEFFKNFLSLTTENLTDDWIRRIGSYFSSAICIYSDEELIRIIRKLIGFKISNTHNNPKSSFVGRSLFGISSIGKSYLFRDFLQQLKDLGYNQFIQDFIKKNPSEKEIIKDYNITILDISDSDCKINSQNIDLLYDENIIDAFEELLEVHPYIPAIVSIFFPAKLELNKDFTNILEEHYDSINFGELESDIPFEYHSILFGTHPRYSKGFFIKKLKEYLSNEKNREFFNPWPSPNFLKYFDKLDKKSQKDVIDLLIERKRYNCIIYSLREAPHKFSNYLDEFLSLNSQNESEIRSIMAIFEVIIRNFSSDDKIIKNILTKMKDIPHTYDKGQLLSFLGEKLEALNCFSEAIKKQISLSQICYIFTDYLLEYLDVNRSSIDLAKIRDLEEELQIIEENFEFLNIIKESTKKFPFKIKFLKARFLLFSGIFYLNLDNYSYARGKFTASNTIFKNLAKSMNLPIYNKEIINVYKLVSSVLPDFLDRIKNLKEVNKIEILNQEFFDQIKEIKSAMTKFDFKTKRILSSLENFKFNENGRLNYLQFELPANFCPLPPPIESIYFEIKSLDQKFFPWNQKLELKTSSDPLDLSSDYQEILLYQKFAKKEEIYYYDIEFSQSKLLKIIYNEQEYKNGVNIFKFDVASEKFIGEREIKITLKPRDSCLVGIDLDLTIRYFKQQKKSKSNDEIIIESMIKCIYQFQQKIKTIKDSENHFSEFLSSLLNNLIDHRKWHIEEQKPSGKSASSGERKLEKIGGLGELDFVFIDEKNMILTICEAIVLNFNDVKSIEEHLLKIFKYDAIGLPFNFIIVYSKVVNFEDLWSKYKETVLNVPFKYELKVKQFYDVSDQYDIKSELRLGKTIHIRQGKQMTLYHFFINTNF